ncbi:MAG: tetratricopeptide (TPR) repeat protein [Limisphaerales bacterium]
MTGSKLAVCAWLRVTDPRSGRHKSRFRGAMREDRFRGHLTSPRSGSATTKITISQNLICARLGLAVSLRVSTGEMKGYCARGYGNRSWLKSGLVCRTHMKHAGVEEFLSSRPEARDCLALLGLFRDGACARMMEAVLLESNSDSAGAADLEVVFERILEDVERTELLTRKGDHWFAVNEAVEAGFRETYLDWPSAQRKPCVGGFVRAYARLAKRIVGLNSLSPVKARGRLRPEMSHLGRAVGFAAGASNWTAARAMLEAMKIGAGQDVALDDWLFVLQETAASAEREREGNAEAGNLWAEAVEEQSRVELKLRRFEDAREHALNLEAHFGSRSDDAGLLRARYRLGRIEFDSDRFVEAETWFKACLDAKHPAAGPESIDIQVLIYLGASLAQQEWPDDAEPYLVSALALAEKRDDEWHVADALLQLSVIAEQRGEYDVARVRAHRSLEIRERLEHDVGRAQALGQLGSISLGRNCPRDAERFYADSLPLWKRIGRKDWVDHTLKKIEEARAGRIRPVAARRPSGRRDDADEQAVAEAEMARVYFERGDHDEAKELLLRCLDQFRKSDDRKRLGWTLAQLGRVAAITDSFSVSQMYFEECVGLMTRDGQREALATVHLQFGQAAERHKKTRFAARQYSECLRLARAIGDEKLQSKALDLMTEIMFALGEKEMSRDYAALNLEIRMRLSDERGVAGAKFQLGRVATVRGEFAVARDRFVECIEASLAAGKLMNAGTALKHLTFACELAACNPDMTDVIRSFGDPDHFIVRHWDSELLNQIKPLDDTPLVWLRKCLVMSESSPEALRDLLKLDFLTSRMPESEREKWASRA